MNIPDFKPRYPNSSQIEIGGRSMKDEKHYITTNKNKILYEGKTLKSMHPGIQAFRNKWLRSRIEKWFRFHLAITTLSTVKLYFYHFLLSHSASSGRKHSLFYSNFSCFKKSSSSLMDPTSSFYSIYFSISLFFYPYSAVSSISSVSVITVEGCGWIYEKNGWANAYSAEIRSSGR